MCPTFRRRVGYNGRRRPGTLRHGTAPVPPSAVYDEVVARFGGDPTPEMREQVAKALVNKALTLGQLERLEQELAAYDDVVARFGEDPRIREELSWAREALADMRPPSQ